MEGARRFNLFQTVKTKYARFVLRKKRINNFYFTGELDDLFDLSLVIYQISTSKMTRNLGEWEGNLVF